MALPGSGDAAAHLLVRHAVKAGLGCKIPPLIGQFRHDLAWWQATEFRRITGFQHRRAFSRAQLVGGSRARHEEAQIRLNLPVFCPAPQGAVADLQRGASLGTPRAGGDGVVDQNNCGLAMWGADPASSFGASDRPPDDLILRYRTASHPPDRRGLFSQNQKRCGFGHGTVLARQFPFQILDAVFLFPGRAT